jgi:hypothetical protein
MKVKILKENELKVKLVEIYKQEQIRVLNETWSQLENHEKQFVLEFLKILNPSKKEVLSEAKWYNLIGDIVGIFDPTGIVDIINGISYWRQGDKLFAILSWISAIPYLGDIIGKPVMGFFKLGGGAAKLFKSAFLAKNVVGMGSLASKYPLLYKFVTSVPKWGPKILEWITKIVSKIPFFGKGMAKSLAEWITLLGRAGKETKLGKNLALKGAELQLGRLMTLGEKKVFLKSLEGTKLFSSYKAMNPSLWSKIRGGVPRLWGNRSVRSLVGRTKWYLGLLTFLGFGNFVGPDELEQKVPDLNQKIEEYTKTPESEKNWNEEFKDVSFDKDETNEPLVSNEPSVSNNNVQSTETSKPQQDPLSSLMSLFS